MRTMKPDRATKILLAALIVVILAFGVQSLLTSRYRYYKDGVTFYRLDTWSGETKWKRVTGDEWR